MSQSAPTDPPLDDATVLHALFEVNEHPLGAFLGPEHVVAYANPGLRLALGRSMGAGQRFRDAAPHLADGRFHAALDRVFGAGQAERVALGGGEALALAPLLGADCEVAGVLVTSPATTLAGASDVDQGAARAWALDMREAELRRRAILLAAREAALAGGRTAPPALVPDPASIDAAVLGAISHELRTPVHALLGFGTLLRRELGEGPTPEAAEHLARMLGATEVLRQRMEDLLDLGRLEAGQLTVDLQPVPFSELVADAIAAARGRAAGKDLHLVAHVDEGLPVVMADRAKFGRAIEKLIDNAVKFTPAGGTITVRGHADAEAAECEIEDTGIGIPATALPHIFEPFATLAPGLVRERPGCGIGLALGRGYVEAQGGALRVGSAEGRGTTCHVAMPRISAHGPLGGDPAGTRRPGPR